MYVYLLGSASLHIPNIYEIEDKIEKIRILQNCMKYAATVEVEYVNTNIGSVIGSYIYK